MLKLVKSSPSPVEDSPPVSEVATRYADAAAMLEEAKAELAIEREALLATVAVEREARLEAGDHGSISLPTASGGRVMVVFRESYKGVSVDNRDTLREAFGEDYSLHCEEVRSLSFKRGLSMDALVAAVGQDAVDVLVAAGFVTEKSELRPRSGAYERIAKLHESGQSETARDLAEFVSACVSSPQVRVK
jgi:hypothetical protein